MSTGQIINAIWELPWYKVFIIAIIDDFILFIKLGWILLIILAIGLVVGFIVSLFK